MRTYFQLRAGRLDEVKGEVVREQPLTVYLSTTDRILFSTGRVSSEMLLKAARMGVPLIASRTSPTEMAVALAEQIGVTVVGYVRGESFNLYAGEAIALPGAA
jgi:FdhD protein